MFIQGVLQRVSHEVPLPPPFLDVLDIVFTFIQTYAGQPHHMRRVQNIFPCVSNACFASHPESQRIDYSVGRTHS